MALAERGDRALAPPLRHEPPPLRAHGGGDGHRLLGHRRRRRAAASAATPWPHNTADHRRLRPRVDRPGGRRRQGHAAQPAGRVHLRRAVAPRRPRGPVAGEQPGHPRLLRRACGRSRRRCSATGPAIRDDGSIRGGGAGEIDPIENLSRFHYLKELFLDSATTMTVLSAVPTGAGHRATRCRSPRRPRPSTPSTGWPPTRTPRR